MEASEPIYLRIERESRARKKVEKKRIRHTRRLIWDVYKNRVELRIRLLRSKQRNESRTSYSYYLDLPYHIREEENPDRYLDLDLVKVELRRILGLSSQSELSLYWVRTYDLYPKGREEFVQSSLRLSIKTPARI